MVKNNNEQEILYFYHCTSIRGKREIERSRALIGSYTDMPSSAPLARNEDVKGTWFSIASDNKLRKSPYGTQRVGFLVKDMLAYLRKNSRQKNDESSEETVASEKSSEAVDEVLKNPKLFFECAHYFGKTQYVRFLLVRAGHPMVTWCRDSCKEVDLCNNLLLEYRDGRLWSRCQGEWKNINLDVLVIGDIHFDQMPRAPVWNKVGTMTRAGGDPRLGLC